MPDQGAGATPAPPHRHAVTGYRIELQACRIAGAGRLAIRAMDLDGRPTLLLVDPQTLATALAPAADWACAPAAPDDLAATPYGAAIREAGARTGMPMGEARHDAGLTRAPGSGSIVTADLCPSHRPLDRWILEALSQRQRPAPVALSYSGAWLRSHAADLDWLKQREAAGDLAVTWVNHSDTHRFVPGLRPDHNLMLLPGTDAIAEILGAERQLVAAGEVPSVFFRFPGLVSTPALAQAVADAHLITLGAAAWLATGQKAVPGGTILVHANGNEPLGLSILARLLQSGSAILPLRPVSDVATGVGRGGVQSRLD